MKGKSILNKEEIPEGFKLILEEQEEATHLKNYYKDRKQHELILWAVKSLVSNRGGDFLWEWGDLFQ